MAGMKIVNMVAIISLSSPLDLDEVARLLPNTEQCKGAAKWLKYRLGSEKKYVAFYKSGKFLITGAKSRSEVDVLANRVVEQLLIHGVPVKIRNVKVNNIVAQGKVDMRGCLEDLVHSLDPGKATYEPEQFPGLIYRDWGVNFLLFSSGRFIATGIRDEKDIEFLSSKFNDLIDELTS